ncbi:glycoside hydrolase family 16 protein [Ramlibacter albus]|uniref:Family 16 glycosylhydrolase n=1 Tax=Ramlibacter albus TaxID=2079448 RepID=A0A923M7B0_9BURK|nr:glycoside hydrolase family 16 protein [Ramlibacter albus]MBC5764218.1 family 16 glycosylhydrolase [Ramlibacter albus]
MAKWMAAVTAMAVLPCAAQWRLVHEENFASGAPLDTSYWSIETGMHRNREAQYYLPDNVRVANGMLTIEARRQEVPNAAYKPGSRSWRTEKRTAQYTSGSLAAKQPLHFGRVEVVARGPSGAGVWPAIWLLHESAGVYGEIDLFEAVGKHPDTTFAGVHWGSEPRTRQHRNSSLLLPKFENNWHTHVLEWTPQRIAVTVDGRPVFSFDPSDAARPGHDPLRKPMHLRINLALGGSWGGPIDDSKLPARLDIASVRVWRWEPESLAAIEPPTIPSRLRAPGPSAPAALTAQTDADPGGAGVPGSGPPALSDAPAPAPRWGR